MSKVCISYRHVDPDEKLAIFLHDRLSDRGHAVFIDRQIEVGDRWIDEIQRNLKAKELKDYLDLSDDTLSDLADESAAPLPQADPVERQLCLGRLLLWRDVLDY